MLRALRDKLTGRVPAGARRSPEWERVRGEFLAGKVCEVCAARHGIEAHHVVPFHLDPARELDPRNLAALCRVCHFVFGRLKNWRSFNPELRSDIVAWRKKIIRAPIRLGGKR